MFLDYVFPIRNKTKNQNMETGFRGVDVITNVRQGFIATLRISGDVPSKLGCISQI